MTMQNQIHPEEERLSALAGGDPEATGDVALRAHIETCDRCTTLVRELGELRVALAQLPDLAPSRPLQLIPPVPEPVPAGGGWLRRLAAPAMAAGAAMVVIGAVGFGATALSRMGAASGAAPAHEDALDGGEAASPATVRGGIAATDSPSPREVTGSESSPSASRDALAGGRSPRPSSDDYRSGGQSPAASGRGTPATGYGDEGTGDEGTGQDLFLTGLDFNQPPAWLALLGAGVVLLLLGMLLRSSLRPRAG